MQEEELAIKENVIVEHPDGSLQLASLMKKTPMKQIACWKCKTKLIYSRADEVIRCEKCNVFIVTVSPEIAVVVTCESCRTILKIPKGAKAFKCLRCHNVSYVSQRNILAKRQNRAQNGAPNGST
mmetsp:Transcript_49534/g.56829  ORF Transcript_49534/g.56829 Transcript_49534/m.56829 type:complete len:125 (+) Transcript_49534:119-493(+)